MTQYVAIFVSGLLFSAHCVGMCGGFAAAIGLSGQAFWPMLGRQLVYSGGRIFTYVFLGGVGGAAGVYLTKFHSHFLTVQQVFTVLAGVIMLIVGFSVLGVVRWPQRFAPKQDGLFTTVFRHFLNLRGWTGFLLAGLATGFLPCGLVYSFLAMAVGAGSVTGGMLVMAAFGLGTVPAMVFVGCGSTLLRHAVRVKIYKTAACFVVLLWVVTIARAFLVDEHHCPACLDLVVR